MNPWPIPPLGVKDLSFGVKNYDFTGLTASQLSSLPAAETLMDSIAKDMQISVFNQEVLLLSMANDLNDLGNVLNEMGTDDFEQILGDLAGIASAGDGMLNDFATLVG